MINWLIERAKRTPYYHLAGYMNRWWLVPYSQVIKREVQTQVGVMTLTDGTGPVKGFRPIARLLQLFDVAVRVHEILHSDEGRDPHDHPWPYLTIVLKGGYYEERYDEHGKLLSIRWHGPGSIIFRPANSWHMLKLAEDGTRIATTLFITGRKAQRWGFNVNGEKVDYVTYLRAKHGN